MSDNNGGHGPLGRRVEYLGEYDPSLLFPIGRTVGRSELSIEAPLPFHGVDIWNAFEVSWLGSGGLPRIAVAEIRVSADSVNIVESKSVKLYLNSFNQSRFNSVEEVSATIERDLGRAVDGDVTVSLILSAQFSVLDCRQPEGICLDGQELVVEHYSPVPTLLQTGASHAEETLYSHLLRTLCPVTGQPDWATVTIDYSGPVIDHQGLLAYLVSFRQHQGFHESCVERIFMDIMTYCKPAQLTVGARFTRRGGIDINPVRSTIMMVFPNRRLARQ